MIDTNSETLVTFPTAARGVPPDGTNVGTIYRWTLRGIRGVRLETILIGGKRYTSLQALERFYQRTTAAAAGENPRKCDSSPRDTAYDAAERRLDALGIKSNSRSQMITNHATGPSEAIERIDRSGETEDVATGD